MQNSRLQYIDALRGMAIVLVAVGHAIQYTDSDFDHNAVFRGIYALHMPLFMFLSGYVTRGPEIKKAGHGQRLQAKLASLLVPYLAWLPIAYICAVLLQHPQGYTGSFMDFLAQVPAAPDLGLWFLLVLAECHLLLVLCSVAGKRWLPWTGAFALLALNILVMTMPAARGFGLNLLRWYFLFFLLGHLLRDKASFPKKQTASLLLLVLFSILASFWYRKSALPVDLLLAGREGAIRQLLTQSYHALTALAGIFGVFGLFAALTRTAWWAPVQRALETLGNRSLQIYAGHYLFLHIIISVLHTLALNFTFRVMIVASFAMTGALLFAYLVSKVPILNRLLYGNHGARISGKGRTSSETLANKTA